MAALRAQDGPSSPRYFGHCSRDQSFIILGAITICTYIRQYVCAQGKANTKKWSVWKRPSQPLDHLSHVPSRSRVIQNAGGDLGHRTSSRVDHTCLPLSTFAEQWVQYLAQIDLVATTAQSMEDYQHRSRICGFEGFEFLAAKIGSPWRQGLVRTLVRRDREIDSERASVSEIFCLENLTLVVYWRILVLHHGPECLKMTIEQERVQTTWRRYRFAKLRQRHLFIVSRKKSERMLCMMECSPSVSR